MSRSSTFVVTVLLSSWGLPASSQELTGSAVASLICDYCIQADDVTILRDNGAQAPLSRLDLRTEKDVDALPGSYPTGPGHPVQPLAHLKTFIEWRPGYKPMHGFRYRRLGNEFPNALATAYLPGVARKDKNVTWRSLVRTHHVCLGARFQVPTFYLVGNNDRPMSATGPGDLAKADDFRDLPATELQTFCEGKLLDINTLLSAFVTKQTQAALAEFKAKSTEKAIQQFVSDATRDYLNEHKTELTNIAAQVLSK